MFPLRFAVDPTAAALLITATLAGVCLGAVSGLVPGLHANTFALLLAAAAAGVPGPRIYVGAAMLAAGVTHSFLDIVPALALGVPDPAMAAGALPGHRLVLEGRGREALRLSALGSGLAVLFAAPLAVPVTAAMTRLYPILTARLSLLLLCVATLLVVTESGVRPTVGAAGALAGSGLLGVSFLDAEPAGALPITDMLVPLFAGLFGAPVLLAAIEGDGVPPQADAQITSPRRAVVSLALVGTLCGAAVSYLPGVSSGIAATLALGVVAGGVPSPGDDVDGSRAFVVTTSGVNTATAVFALFALVALGTPRTGVLVAMERAEVPTAVPELLAAIAVAAVVSTLLVPLVGDRYLRSVGRLDPTALSVGALALLVVLSAVFAGPIGVAAFAAATLVGHVPPRFGARRVSLMGVLLVPLAL